MSHGAQGSVARVRYFRDDAAALWRVDSVAGRHPLARVRLEARARYGTDASAVCRSVIASASTVARGVDAQNIAIVKCGGIASFFSMAGIDHSSDRSPHIGGIRAGHSIDAAVEDPINAAITVI